MTSAHQDHINNPKEIIIGVQPFLLFARMEAVLMGEPHRVGEIHFFQRGRKIIEAHEVVWILGKMWIGTHDGAQNRANAN